MNAFAEGFSHITDLNGVDHMLFLLAVAAGLTFAAWRSLLRITLAFTVGHSLTLILASLGWMPVPRDIVELLIPCTIIAAAVRRWRNQTQSTHKEDLIWVGLFGLIHGMGFSSYFRMMYDETPQVVWNLFQFNVGIEAGQVLIVGAVVTVNTLLVQAARLNGTRVLLSELIFVIGASLALLVSLISGL